MENPVPGGRGVDLVREIEQAEAELDGTIHGADQPLADSRGTCLLSVEAFLLPEEVTALGEGMPGKREGTTLLQQGTTPILEAMSLLPEGTFAEIYPSPLPFYPQGHRLEATFAKMKG